MPHYELHRGHLPLLISVPHHGSEIPPDLAARLQPEARRSPDSDHHVARLYRFATAIGASLLVPRWSRYVIDLNRPPSATALYPGQRETGLVPLTSFADSPLYLPGQEPDASEIQARIDRYWRPYHHALLDELLRLRQRHPRVLLWEGHSIISECPLFFEGRLPDFNLGTAAGTSCAPALEQALAQVMDQQSRFSHVLNGRFKGGYITRHYGRPAEGLHSVQLELAQCNYMQEDGSLAWRDDGAAEVQALIGRLLEEGLRWAGAG